MESQCVHRRWATACNDRSEASPPVSELHSSLAHPSPTSSSQTLLNLLQVDTSRIYSSSHMLRDSSVSLHSLRGTEIEMKCERQWLIIASRAAEGLEDS